MKTKTEIKELNGKQLYYSFLAGAQKIFENQQQINRINVFPVPDGDTGTNLASTMQSIVESTIPTRNIKFTADALADAALIGARGNSGIIFAQFLYGFSNEMEDGKALTVESFAQIMKKASDYTYEAVANPVDGTMISVIREWADYVYSLKDKIDDFKELILESYQKAKILLAETKMKLEVLRKSNVVDAGAKGFVDFLGGMSDFLENGEIRKILRKARVFTTAELPVVSHEKFNYRYCTEGMVVGDNIATDKIKELLKEAGDSVVMAGSKTKMRFHVHTNKPARLFHDIARWGDITQQKVDDMVFQDKVLHDRKSSIAVVTDSTSDLPRKLIDEYHIHIIPLNVHFGKTQYLDRITITPKKFYEKLIASPVYPSTSQPGKREFLNKFNYLASHYESIIGMFLSSDLSGTHQNADKAARDVSESTDIKITTVDSRTISAGLGLMVLRTLEALEAGHSHEEVLQQIEEWKGKTRLFIAIRSLDSFIRGGRVSPLKGYMGKLMNVKPILEVKEGKVVPKEKVYSRKQSIERILKFIGKEENEHGIHQYAVMYSNKEEKSKALEIEERIKGIIGKPAAYITPVSPVIGVSAGIGTLGVALMLK